LSAVAKKCLKSADHIATKSVRHPEVMQESGMVDRMEGS